LPHSHSLSSERPSAFSDAELVKQLNDLGSLLDRTESLSNRASRAANRLQRALIEIEVRQLKQQAIAQEVWDFYRRFLRV